MSAVDLANELIKRIEGKDIAAAEKLLSNDFVFSGPVPQPINGSEWLAMQERLNVAFPDWKFNLSDLHADGDVVHGIVQITGTHKGKLDLSSLGLPNVPATGRSIKLPREEVTLTVSGDKITSLDAPTTEAGGVVGILSQLGVKLPTQ